MSWFEFFYCITNQYDSFTSALQTKIPSYAPKYMHSLSLQSPLCYVCSNSYDERVQILVWVHYKYGYRETTFFLKKN